MNLSCETAHFTMGGFIVTLVKKHLEAVASKASAVRLPSGDSEAARGYLVQVIIVRCAFRLCRYYGLEGLVLTTRLTRGSDFE